MIREWIFHFAGAKVSLIRFLCSGVLSLSFAAAHAAAVVDLDQGWSKAQANLWYESTQGSRLIPLSWFLALEQKDSLTPFLSDDNIRRYAYEPRTLTHSTIRLPRGFVVDRTDASGLPRTNLRWTASQSAIEPWVGMTCSACHTATITYRGSTLTVQGAPTNADLQSFFEGLDASLEQTSSDPAKFARFSAQVLKKADSPANRQLLASALAQVVKTESLLAQLNQTDLRYGFGRLDAVGHILNRVEILSGATSPPAHPADAPVSYPFLWNVPQQDKLQWNGMAMNSRLPAVFGDGLDIGALGRNTGEVIGVFADVNVLGNPVLLQGYASSLNTKNMVGLEDQLRHLKPPKWPSALFGAPDPQLAHDGKTLFEQHCLRCHASPDRTDLDTPLKAAMVKLVQDGAEAPIGTDIWMACNAFYAHGPTGLLQGQTEITGTGTVGADDKLANLLAVQVKQVLLAKKYDVAALAAVGFFGVEPTPTPANLQQLENLLKSYVPLLREQDLREKICLSTNDALLAYKGRSLNGIWATAPYLHNGSVPTLYDLLLPPAQRPPTFSTGSTEFDPKKVGFDTTGVGPNIFVFDTTKSGNSNQGHDYGASSFTEIERRSLVEYLKTL
jgi:hypothetical protein